MEALEAASRPITGGHNGARSPIGLSKTGEEGTTQP